MFSQGIAGFEVTTLSTFVERMSMVLLLRIKLWRRIVPLEKSVTSNFFILLSFIKTLADCVLFKLTPCDW